jgi:hypothetical protein
MSLVSSVSPCIDMFCFNTPNHLSLCFPILHISAGFHARILLDDLFTGILFTCPNYLNGFSSVTSHVLFPASMVALMVSFLAFSHFYFPAIFYKNPAHLQVVYKRVVYLASAFVLQPVPVAAWSKACVSGRTFVGIAGPNPTVAMDVYCELCVVR